MVVVAGESNLLEIVLALGAAGCFTSLLDSGQEQSDKDRNDCDHDQEFNQRETTPIRSLQAASRLSHQKILQRQKKKTTPLTNRQPASHGTCGLKYSRINAEQAWMSPWSGVRERPNPLVVQRSHTQRLKQVEQKLHRVAANSRLLYAIGGSLNENLC
jgi:hypothetical protein